MKNIAFYNGTFAPIEEIKIPLSDRAIYFGDGIYEAAIGRNDNIYLEDYHLARFLENAKKLNLDLKYSVQNIRELLHLSIEMNPADCFFIYFQLTRSEYERKHSYSTNDSNLLITVTPIQAPTSKLTMKLITANDERHSLCGIKTLNLLAAVIASKKASMQGCDEAILFKDNLITECAHSNVFIVKSNELVTRPTDGTILPGITRKRILELAKELNIKASERPFSLNELYEADEVLITSSSKLCARGKSVDEIYYTLSENSVGRTLCDAIFKDFSDSTA